MKEEGADGGSEEGGGVGGVRGATLISERSHTNRWAHPEATGRCRSVRTGREARALRVDGEVAISSGGLAE